MSRQIRADDLYIEELRKAFEEHISKVKSKGRALDGKMTFGFSKTFEQQDRKATVFFTPEAWLKMSMLVAQWSKEIAWHGVAERLDTEGADEYLVSDILVYPQKVTSTTVDMDPTEYNGWLVNGLMAGDERFDKLFLQGHSHVEMSVTPSGTDIAHQANILGNLKDDGFYIFIIYNKKHDFNLKVYDLQKNVLFENGDCNLRIFGSTENINDFLADAKKLVRETGYSYQGQGTARQYPYYSAGTAQTTGQQTPSKTADVSTQTATKPKEKYGRDWRSKYGFDSFDESDGWY